MSKFELIDDIKSEIEDSIEYLLENGYELDEIEVDDIGVDDTVDALTPVYDVDLLSLLESDKYTFGWEQIEPIIREHAYEFIYNKIYELFDEVKEEMSDD